MLDICVWQTKVKTIFSALINFFLFIEMSFYVVCFKNTTLKVIKKSWVDGAKSADFKNYGFLPSKEVKIFYSKRSAQRANFECEVMDYFDEEKTGCYIGFLLAVFGEYFAIINIYEAKIYFAFMF